MIKFYGYLLYRYYSTGKTKDVAYIKTITTIVFLLVMNIVSLLILINKTAMLSIINSDKKWMQYLNIGIVGLPLFLFFLFLLKEKELKVASYSATEIRKGNKFLLLYIICTFVLLFGLMIYKAFFR